MSLKFFFSDLGLLGAIRSQSSCLGSSDGIMKPFKYETAASKLIVVYVCRTLLSSLKNKQVET